MSDIIKVFREANVTITVDGLGIYFKNSDGSWDFDFLRNLEDPQLVEKHELRIKITRQGGEASDRTTHEFRIPKGHNFYLTGETETLDPENRSIIDNHIHDENFNYQEAEEYINDTGWMTSLVRSGESLPTRANLSIARADVSTLTLPTNGILYAKAISVANFEVWEKTVDKNGFTTDRKMLTDGMGRKVGATVGVDFKCVGDNLVFVVEGPLGYKLNLPLGDGVIYDIAFDNSCVDNPLCAYQSDFKHYYDIFKTSTQKELIPIPLPDKHGLKGKPGSTAACSNTPGGG